MQFQCFSPPSHCASTAQRGYCHQRPRGPGWPWCTGQPLSTPPPEGAFPRVCGADDALQRRTENKDNMHSGQHTKAKENGTAPPERGSGRAEAETPHVQMPITTVDILQLSSRASAQRGHDTPAAPAHDYTSRFPGWLLPHSHS